MWTMSLFDAGEKLVRAVHLSDVVPQVDEALTSSSPPPSC